MKKTILVTMAIIMITALAFAGFSPIFVAAAASGGSYHPVPAPVPMGDYIINIGETFDDIFYIGDANGPAGMTIGCEPVGLIISEPNILTFPAYPDAREYAYPYSFTPTSAGEFTFTIIATDSRGRSVEQTIHFTVLGDALHVFTGCKKMGYVPNSTPVSGIWWNNIQQNMRNNSRNNLVFHYNRVVEGKEPLSPKYENIGVLKTLIAKYDNPSYVVMNGSLVEN